MYGPPCGARMRDGERSGWGATAAPTSLSLLYSSSTTSTEPGPTIVGLHGKVRLQHRQWPCGHTCVPRPEVLAEGRPSGLPRVLGLCLCDRGAYSSRGPHGLQF